jgi:hypothetical protein
MWSWISKIDPNVAIAIVTTVGSWLFHRSSKGKQDKIDAALKAARNVISQIIITALPDMTVERLIVLSQKVVDAHLAKIGIRRDDSRVRALVSEIVSNGVSSFVQLHREPKTLTPPAAR